MDTRSASPHDASEHFHAVRFYENQASLCRTVADFLSEGLLLGQPALVIATPSHREGILSELRTRHLDVDQAQADGDLVWLDARTTLATFMVDEMPDASLFNAVLPEALNRVSRGRRGCKIRAYGEMVDVLWQDGRTTAAIRLEMMWNQLAATHEFSLLCGYSMGSFYKDAGMREICAQHSHVVSADSPLADSASASSN